MRTLNLMLDSNVQKITNLENSKNFKLNLTKIKLLHSRFTIFIFCFNLNKES